jgi:hypothetical protein
MTFANGSFQVGNGGHFLKPNVRVCVKLASAMQPIKGFFASGLWKTDCCAITPGAIASCPVRLAAGKQDSPTTFSFT